MTCDFVTIDERDCDINNRNDIGAISKDKTKTSEWNENDTNIVDVHAANVDDAVTVKIKKNHKITCVHIRNASFARGFGTVTIYTINLCVAYGRIYNLQCDVSTLFLLTFEMCSCRSRSNTKK